LLSKLPKNVKFRQKLAVLDIHNTIKGQKERECMILKRERERECVYDRKERKTINRQKERQIQYDSKNWQFIAVVKSSNCHVITVVKK
jgi:hypothetical protein